MKKAILLITTLLALVSCGERTPQDLFDEDKSGVVLILNEYYYTMKLPNGNTLYFTGIDDDGSLENLSADYNDRSEERR